MSQLKKLAGQTAIYGLPTIVGRLLNYLLVPIYTRVLLTDQYGVVTDLYAYVAFLGVLLTYGMETAFFRYSQKASNKNEVYNTAFLSILSTSTIFIGFCLLFKEAISSFLGYKTNQEYIIIFVFVLALDALRAIPFALLRQQEKAFRFAFIKSVDILTNIGLNLFFLLVCPYILKNTSGGALYTFIDSIYNPDNKVLYIFVSNLIASIISFILLSPQLALIRFKFDTKMWKSMIIYALPIMIGGLAGIINEVFDRIALKHLIPEDQNPMSQLGIYGACYKVSIIMSLFIQAFRFAAEPFFFQRAKYANARETYAAIMKYFVIICAAVFLGVMLFIEPISTIFLGKNFREGIGIVPILLMANLFLGVYYNLSIWYKLNDKTIWGAYIGLFGAAITLILNIVLVPIMGYYGAAWATFICYFVITAISYFMGQKYYPIPYETKRILFYILLALAIYFISLYIPVKDGLVNSIVGCVLFGLFLFITYILDVKKVLKTK